MLWVVGIFVLWLLFAARWRNFFAGALIVLAASLEGAEAMSAPAFAGLPASAALACLAYAAAGFGAILAARLKGVADAAAS